jgi:hypothetical protein
MSLHYFDQLQYGVFKDIEAIVDPKTRDLWIVQASVGRMLDLGLANRVSEKLASKSFKAFADYLGISVEIKTIEFKDSKGRPNIAKGISLETFEVFAAWIYRNFNNSNLFESLSDKSKLYASSYDHFINIDKIASKLSKHGTEKIVQKRLSRNLDGQMEVLTPVGRIDILTSTEIIEVKEAKSWKAAMGQVIAYGYFYPSHQKRIHLYGAIHSASKDYIEKVCRTSSVIVTWEK